MQCYVYTDYPEGKLRDHIRKKFGKGTYSLSKMRGEALKSYVLKEDLEIDYRGFTSDEIEVFKSKSYKKPLSYKARKEALSDQYVNMEIGLDTFLISLIGLHTEYKVEYNEPRILNYVAMLNFKRHPELIGDKVNELVRNFKNNIFLETITKENGDS